MPQLQEHNNHSEEAQEILGQIPPWTIRWGITVIFFIFSIIILGSYFIKYPETINSTAVINITDTTINIIAKKSGYIEHIFVSDNMNVSKGDILGVITSNANYKDILFIDSTFLSIPEYSIDSIVYDNRIYEEYSMGNMQSDWITLSSLCKKYKNFLDHTPVESGNEETYSMKEKIKIEFKKLHTKIKSWKSLHLFISPTNGKISFVHNWKKGDLINSGESFSTIISNEGGRITGILQIPQYNFGKVNIGQSVNIKLYAYPYMEYGMLIGKISMLSSIPEEPIQGQSESQHYKAIIIFPNGLTTTHGKELRPIRQMNGTAEIITENKRLITRFIEPIILLFKQGI